VRRSESRSPGFERCESQLGLLPPCRRLPRERRSTMPGSPMFVTCCIRVNQHVRLGSRVLSPGFPTRGHPTAQSPRGGGPGVRGANSTCDEMAPARGVGHPARGERRYGATWGAFYARPTQTARRNLMRSDSSARVPAVRSRCRDRVRPDESGSVPQANWRIVKCGECLYARRLPIPMPEVAALAGAGRSTPGSPRDPPWNPRNQVRFERGSNPAGPPSVLATS